MRIRGVMWQSGFFFLISFLVISCSSKNQLNSGIFIEPKNMEPMFQFWEFVYSEWDNDKVVFHDNIYMDVIYKIAPIAAGNSQITQLEHVKIARKLDHIEAKLVNDHPLTHDEKKIVTQLRKSGGQGALRNISERLRSQRGLKSNFKAGLERSHAYLPYFKAAFKAKGLPEELAYLPHVESTFVNHARSKVGASGMWQFMSSTARDFLPMNHNVIDGRMDPFMAAKGAASLMMVNYGITKSIPLAITSYNHGAGGMLKAKQEFGDNIDQIVFSYKGARFGFASRNFYAEFIAAKRIAENPNHYFSHITYQKIPNIESMVLHSPMKLSELSKRTGIPIYQLSELNPAWLSRIVDNRVNIPAGIDVWLPKGTYQRMNQQSLGYLAEIQPN